MILSVIDAWAELHKMTNKECGRCAVPYSCCSREYCELAEEYALKLGVVLEKTFYPDLPFMGSEGCVVVPELRPLHTCDIVSLGFHKTDPVWTERYFEFRAIVSAVVKLVVKNNRITGNQFLGCPNWPRCNYTQGIPESWYMRAMGQQEMFDEF
jgi:hypothetical protein